MGSDEAARKPEQSAMDCLNRVLSEEGDNLDRVVILTIPKDGDSSGLYSNCRSEAEMFGLLFMAMHMTEDVG
jgi:hypothetical protein